MWRMSGDQAQAKPKSRWPRRGWTGRPVSDSMTHASGESPITTRRRLSGDVAVQFIGWESSWSEVKTFVSVSRMRRCLSFEAKTPVGEGPVRLGIMSMWLVMPSLKSGVTRPFMPGLEPLVLRRAYSPQNPPAIVRPWAVFMVDILTGPRKPDSGSGWLMSIIQRASPVVGVQENTLELEAKWTVFDAGVDIRLRSWKCSIDALCEVCMELSRKNVSFCGRRFAWLMWE